MPRQSSCVVVLHACIFMSRTEAITCLLQIVTLSGYEEKYGRSKGYKGSKHPNASSVAAVVGEKAHLGMK